MLTATEEKKTRTVKVLAVTQRQAVLNAMPGTANQIAERTGTNVNAVWHHIYSLRDSGEVEKAAAFYEKKDSKEGVPT